MFHEVAFFIVQFLFLPSSRGVSLGKRFKKSPVNAEFLEFVIKRRSANHSWRPSSKAAPKKVTVTVMGSSHLLAYSGVIWSVCEFYDR